MEKTSHRSVPELKFSLRISSVLILCYPLIANSTEKLNLSPFTEQRSGLHYENKQNPAQFLDNAKKTEEERESEICQLSYFKESEASSQLSSSHKFDHLYQPNHNISSLADNPQSVRIDLHGYSVERARKFTFSIIRQASKLNLVKIHFICGRGKHKNAKGQRGTIFKAFPEWLKEENISPLLKSFQVGIGTYEVFLNSAQQPENKCGYVLKTEVIQSLANLHDPNAQFTLGELYYEGTRVKKDLKAAVRWYRQAANQGHADAQLRLGYMCAMGLGTLYDPAQAMLWYGKAAELGLGTACFNLGTMHYVGEGVARDLLKAAKYYLQGGELNDSLCQRMLGIFYRQGYGVTPNDEEAVKWDRLAVDNGDGPAKVNLGYMLLEGRGCAKDPEAAFKLFTEAAQKKITEAYFRLGEMHACGRGVEKDLHQAVGWYLKAALKDDDWSSYEAQYIIGFFYYKGIVLKSDDTKAAHWYLKAAENGHSQAQWRIGLLYRWGGGVKQDSLKSYQWIKASAKKGNHWGQYHLAEIYSGGFGIKANTKRQLMWLHRAAGQGNAMACIMVGKIPEELQKALDKADSQKLASYGLVFCEAPKQLQKLKNEKASDLSNMEDRTSKPLSKASKRKKARMNRSVKGEQIEPLSQESQLTLSSEPIPQGFNALHSLAKKGLDSLPNLEVKPSDQVEITEARTSSISCERSAPLKPEGCSQDLAVKSSANIATKGWFHNFLSVPLTQLRASGKPVIGLI